MAESAIIVRLAIPRRIERIRRATVASAGLGVPAHVTILYPFLRPDELTRQVRADLAAVAHELRAFDVHLAVVARWPRILHLEPEPRTPFVALTDRVAARYPEHQPYGGSFDEVIPHLTVAEGIEDAARLDALEADVRGALPCAAHAAGLEVIAQGSDGRWRRRWALPFRS